MYFYFNLILLSSFNISMPCHYTSIAIHLLTVAWRVPPFLALPSSLTFHLTFYHPPWFSLTKPVSSSNVPWCFFLVFYDTHFSLSGKLFPSHYLNPWCVLKGRAHILHKLSKITFRHYHSFHTLEVKSEASMGFCLSSFLGDSGSKRGRL